MNIYYDNSVIRRLSSFATLSPVERAIVWKACQKTSRFVPGAEIPISSRAQYFLLSGWACKQWQGADGRQQVIDFILPGDLIELDIIQVGDAFVAVRALTEIRVSNASEVQQQADRNGGAASALQTALVRSRLAVQRRVLEQLIRLGTLTGVEALRSLLAQLYERLETVQMAGDRRFECPITQAVFAEALGTSPIHMNRMFKALEREGFLQSKGPRKILNRIAEPVASSPDYAAADAAVVPRPEASMRQGVAAASFI